MFLFVREKKEILGGFVFIFKLEMVAIATNRRLLGMLALLGASRSATPIAVGTGTSVRQGFALPAWRRQDALRACGRRCIGLPRTRGTCSDWIQSAAISGRC